MTAREAFAAIGRGESLQGRRVVLTPAEEKVVESMMMIGEAYGRGMRRAAEAMAEAGRLCGEGLRRDLEALAARLRETR